MNKSSHPRYTYEVFRLFDSWFQQRFVTALENTSVWSSRVASRR